MSAVTTEKSKTAGAVVDEPVVPVQAGPVDEQAATAEAIAAALDPALVSRLAAQARAQGVQLLGRGGVLQQLTKRFLEAALEAEMDEHLARKWCFGGRGLATRVVSCRGDRLCGGFEGDGVAEALKLADEVSGLLFGVDPAGVPVGAEVDEVSVVIG